MQLLFLDTFSIIYILVIWTIFFFLLQNINSHFLISGVNQHLRADMQHNSYH